MPVVLELFLTFFRISLFTIGGGYAMIPLFQKELVTVHGWITAEQMLDMLTVAEMTPGPIAINLATYAGYHAAGFWGALAATAGLVTPSGIIILIIARFLKHFQDMPVVRAVLQGIRPMVVVLISVAAFTVARTALHGSLAVGILLAALVAAVRFKTHPILLIIVAGVLGVIFEI
ncbi:chromate transporter [Clostridiales bacterium PH28_bin88]|nr:chromate transporter [Clostridiales bacterium PH28_bin88]